MTSVGNSPLSASLLLCVALCCLNYIFRSRLGSFCAPGRFQVDGICIPCRQGMFKSSWGPQECSICQSGTYSQSGAASCARCPSGTISRKGSSQCSSCPAGTFSNKISTNCVKCSAGTFSSQGSGECLACAAGTTSQGGSASCKLCSTGYFSGANAPKCTSCPEGWVSAAGSTGLVDCLPSATDALSMVVFGAQNAAQREWQRLMNANVVDLLMLAATGSLDYILAWMCHYLFNGNQDGCFARYAHEGDDAERHTHQHKHGDKEKDKHQEQGSQDAFGHIHACTADVVVERMEKLPQYKAFKQSLGTIASAWGTPARESCNVLKKSAKKLLLLVHPDKFNRLHPECAADVSTRATEIVARMFVGAKSKCSL